VINLQAFINFVQSSKFGGVLLLACVLLSLTVANMGAAGTVESLLATELGYENSWLHLNYSAAMWINDGLMAVFFLLVGLEIKRELVEGELSSPRKAALPVLCAVGGAIVPAALYLSFTAGVPAQSGWGIPMATDIAFALSIISLLDRRVPLSLKIFLAAIAIADDLIAILVIAVFYSSGIQLTYLLYAAAAMAVLVVMNRMDIKNQWLYLLPGVFVWYFIHHSGIHATIAGVLVAMTLPTNSTDAPSPLEKLEHALVKPVNFLIIPLFAFANTNIRLEPEMIQGLTAPLGLGIMTGLLIGKPAGILISTFILTKLKVADLPEGSNWLHILGVGLLAGIGFTMSIFISILSFSDLLLVSEAKLSVLISSCVAGATGYIILSAAGSNENSGALSEQEQA